ncbi:MAG: hypothetical protein GY801_23390 [bacterium]|nr:hypothetical protein [bacterium]
MTEWHRLFGLSLIDYFADSSYTVKLEKDLSLKQQFVDVVIIEQEAGIPLQEVPDGLENLGRHNILSYKSFQESFNAWACDELLGHYVNYRKQISPSMDRLLPESEFRLYGVSTRYPQKLASSTTFLPVKPGVYDLTWGSRNIRLLVLSRIAETERNAIWQLFSADPEHVQYGASHYQWHMQQLSTIVQELYKRYRLEGISMPYTVNDYYLEVARANLNLLSPEERVKDLSPEERVKDLSPDEILELLLSGATLEHISPDKRERLLQKIRQQHDLS